MFLSRNMFRLFLVAPLLAAAALADTVTISGQVVDERGKPVKDAEVGVNWTGSERDWTCDGSARTDKEGKFSAEIDVEKGKPVAILAFDKPRRRGGLTVAADSFDALKITIDTVGTYAGMVDLRSLKHAPDTVEIVLSAVADTGHTAPVMRTEWPAKKKFQVRIPPGSYEVAFECDAGERTPRKLTIKSGKTEEVGKLALSPKVDREPKDKPADKSLGAEDKGKPAQPASKPAATPAPPLSVSEARGAKPNVRIADYKGKWLVIGFWGTWQSSCVTRAIPWMIKLPEIHKAHKDKLALLSFHFNRGGDQALATIEPELARLEKEQWQGRLPFPVLVDASGKTVNDWSIDRYPTLILIDPEGNIAARGEVAIEARLLLAFGQSKEAAPPKPEKSDPARPRDGRGRP